MAEHLGKLIICDRCGKTQFLHHLKTETLDGGYTKVDKYDKRPDGWEYHSDTGLLCDECEKLYQELLNKFFDR